jgi:glycosyltransferase involved in cell wall biosynthesis
MNVGFVSTRFAGTDGVTLESSKWADVLKQYGHDCFWFAGEIDRDLEKSFVVPEAHFIHETIDWINERVIGKKERSPAVTQTIHDTRSLLKKNLHKFINGFQIDLLIAENVLTIPMNIPLGLALTETIAETRIPTIAHHHDFFWERMRFSVNAVSDYLQMAFPPNLSNIQHVVINSDAQEQLALRTGISSVIIPNVLDFENPPKINGKRTEEFKNSIGLMTDDIMILQPTRIIKRKGIEHAIELVKELKDERYKLVVSHQAGDEGFEYVNWLEAYAKEHQVELFLTESQIPDPWACSEKRGEGFTLWDVYPLADFITYPSLYEGFGNAFLEAIYFKKPMLVNRYSTFVRDIEPYGFDLCIMDGFLSKKTVHNVRAVLESPEKKNKMVNWNYDKAAKYYSYSVLRSQLNGIISNSFDKRLNEQECVLCNNVSVKEEPWLYA